jgi:hypothetical protein
MMPLLDGTIYTASIKELQQRFGLDDEQVRFIETTMRMAQHVTDLSRLKRECFGEAIFNADKKKRTEAAILYCKLKALEQTRTLANGT